MSTKEQVLELLKNSGTAFLSGQEIADKLFVTRAAVWKAIKALQNQGHEIEAITNKGYRLKVEEFIPNEAELRAQLMSHPLYEKFSNVKRPDFILSLDSLESTNLYAQEIATKEPGKEGLIVAGSQTGGRGRRGRSFYSPENTGIYMSLLLFPKKDFKETAGITCMTAVCVCKAIKEVTGLDVEIKWVNDIFYKGKKVGGILTEAISSLEDGMLSYIIVGIGINLYEPYEGFPTELKKIAGGLLKGIISKEVKTKLIAEIFMQFGLHYYFSEEYPYIEDYKSHSMLIGKYVKINTYGNAPAHGSGYALVTGIDDECHLMIKYEDGTEDTLSSGEVSVVKY